MRLNRISDNAGAATKRKRRGRGMGTGLGKTAGRGHKGQGARSGGSKKNFEGGQTPIHRRLPKRGFKGRLKKFKAEILSTEKLNNFVISYNIDANVVITEQLLLKYKIVNRTPVKLLASGELSVAVRINLTFFSKVAKRMIESIGGVITSTSVINPVLIHRSDYMKITGAVSRINSFDEIQLDTNYGRNPHMRAIKPPRFELSITFADIGEKLDFNAEEWSISLMGKSVDFPARSFFLSELDRELDEMQGRITARFGGKIIGERPWIDVSILHKNRIFASERLEI